MPTDKREEGMGPHEQRGREMIPAAIAVQRYASCGLAVLPIVARGKTPLAELAPHGVHSATTDPDVLRGWWARVPTANVAIAVPPHWLVVDVDPRNGGDESLADLVAKHGELPTTLTARTGSGGAHYVYARDPAVMLRGKLAAGVDLLSRGRYFLVAPSVHPSGGVYVWANRAPIAPTPAWLLTLAAVTAADSSPPPSTRPHPPASVVDRARRYLAAMPAAISGSGGHSATFAAACVLVRGFALDAREAMSLLREWNVSHCRPPWRDADLLHKILSASRDGRMAMASLRDRRRAE